MGNVGLVHARKVMHAAKDCAIKNLAKTHCEPSIKAGNRYHLQPNVPHSDVDRIVLDVSEKGGVPSPRGVSQCTFHTIENPGSDDRARDIT
jgi:hypothetical protein